MTVVDKASWLGNLPPIPKESYLPTDFDYDYPENFVNMFNEDPIQAEQYLLSKSIVFENPYYLGSYLCYCPDLNPTPLQTALFANPMLSRTLLYHFFSSLNLEFVSLYDAGYLLLSRISFPNNLEQLIMIFDVITDVYINQNPYLKLPKEQLMMVFVVFVMFSVYHKGIEVMPFTHFAQYLHMVLGISEKQKMEIYDCLVKKPIPLFFTFRLSCEKPTFERAGELRKSGSILMSKKKRLYKISGFKLQSYDSKGQLVEELPLKGVVAEYVYSSNSKIGYIELKNPDGSLLNYNLKNPGKETGQLDCELSSWAEDINFISFVSLLHFIVGKPPIRD